MSGVDEARPFWRRLLDGWMVITARFGFAQTLVILTLFYAFLIGPAATIARGVARQDLLAKRPLQASGSAWGEPDTSGPDLERSKQQF